MNFVSKTRNCVPKTRKLCIKNEEFALNVMNFAAGCQTPTSFMHTYLTGAVHAVADAVEGPYSFVDVSVPGELENPMAVPDGKGMRICERFRRFHPSISRSFPAFSADPRPIYTIFLYSILCNVMHLIQYIYIMTTRKCGQGVC